VKAQTIELEGIPVRIPTPSALYRMKKFSIRPIDRADAAAPHERFDLGEL
jgi:hypothetical protein